MRFHVVRDFDRQPVDFFVRVIQVRRERYHGPEGCWCTHVYRVVPDSVGIEEVKQGAYRDGQKFICDCHGEVISG